MSDPTDPPAPVNRLYPLPSPPEGRRVSLAEYVAAFAAWQSVATKLTDEMRSLLTEGMKALAAVFRDHDQPRDIDAYCAALDAFLHGRSVSDRASCSGLRLRITKSCLLKRLLYIGEPLRTVPCPVHKGRWQGCFMEPCPHGCDTCGCTTGWLPPAPKAPAEKRTIFAMLCNPIEPEPTSASPEATDPADAPPDYPGRELREFYTKPSGCRSGSDGDCDWAHCPQLRDGEPQATGRHCPLDVGKEEH